MEERFEVSSVDVIDSNAMSEWARGMCKGQTVEHLAAIYKVDATVRSVANAIGRNFPDKTRRVVTQVCQDELEQLRSVK